MFFRLPGLALASLVILISLPNNLLAQSITLSGPATTLPDADEFFTDIWASPKDFNDVCDIGFDNWHFEPETTSGGVWTGVHPALNSAPPLGVMPIPTPGSYPAFREDCGRLGLNTPLDAGKYTNLSYRIKLTSPSSFSVLWSKNNIFAIDGFADFDGYFIQQAGVSTEANEWSIKNLDMVSRAPASLPWTGNITGLTILPSFGQPAGGNVQMDWMRLIDPSTSPSITLSWNMTGSSSDAPRDNAVIYVDTDNSGFDGEPLVRDLPRSGSTEIDTGLLPPGEYYFYANFETDNEFTPRVIANSAYVGPIRINAKPVVKVTSPSRTSGREYSRDERGDAWDMNQNTDLENLVFPDGTPTGPEFKGFNSESFSGGYFIATTDDDPSRGNVDTQVHFTVPGHAPVNPREYRYFCINIQAESNLLSRARDGNTVLLNDAGYIGRLIWQQAGLPASLGSTFAWELVERSQTFPDVDKGLVEYCVDLWDPAILESGPAWQDVTRIDTVRFDPLEAADPTRFMIDYAALYAENRVDASGQYQITWDANDKDGDALQVSLYYDSDNSGFNGTLITTLSGQASGSGSYNWDTSGVADGDYYVYAVVNDGLNTQRAYSNVTVSVGEIALPPQPAETPCDFDGDGFTDPGIARGGLDFSPSWWFILNSSDGGLQNFPWGSRALDTMIAADINGDRVTDKLAVRSKLDPFVTFFTELSASLGQLTQPWGLQGDVPFQADLDGDGVDDYSVFRPADGTWWSIRSSLGAVGLFWGAFGDIPAVGDYDGDGWDDIAVWRPSDGFWWILQSTRGASTAPADILYRQWGLPGDHPMPGDYTGDGVADMVIWRPTDGNWFVCTSESGFDCTNFEITQFGLPGDMPIKADFDGDGTLDKAVWRPSSGTWFYLRSSDGVIGATQWGLPGDWPLCTGMRDTMRDVGHTYIP